MSQRTRARGRGRSGLAPSNIGALALALAGLLAATGPAPAQDGASSTFDPGDPPVRLDLTPRPPSGFFGVAAASTFGPTNPSAWRPLKLRTFFSEGWDEAWTPEPDNSGDSQQGWINAADGNFYRLFFFSYNYTNRLAGGGNGNTGGYTLYTPFSRRLELVTNIPFVTSQPTFGVGKQTFPSPNPTPPSRPPGRPIATGFGDMSFTPRVMLLEEDDYTAIAQLAVQVPTGDRRAGAGQSIVSPAVQGWWNFAEGWVARAGFSAGVGTNRQAGGTTLLSQLAVGKVFTPDDVPIFGDFTLYLAANSFNTVSSGGTTVTLTPGFRTHLGRGYYALGAVEVPVTGPRPYEEGAIFWLMKTF